MKVDNKTSVVDPFGIYELLRAYNIIQSITLSLNFIIR